MYSRVQVSGGLEEKKGLCATWLQKDPSMLAI